MTNLTPTKRKVRCPDCKGFGELVSYSVSGDWSGPIRTMVYPCCLCDTTGWVDAEVTR